MTEQLDPNDIQDPDERIGWMLGKLTAAMWRAGKADKPLKISPEQCRAYAATFDREMAR